MRPWAARSGAAAAVAALLLGLWMWENAAWLALRGGAPHQQAAVWAARSAAMGLMAASQLALVACVADRFYRSDRFSRLLKFSAALAVALSVLCAMTLGIAGMTGP